MLAPFITWPRHGQQEKLRHPVATSRPSGCDYREFRPYLNQHPWGTLIADLVDAHWVFCWQALRSLKTGSLCLAQSSGASKCREFVSRKNPVLDQQKFGRVAKEKRHFRSGKTNVDVTGSVRLSGASLVSVV